MMDCLKEIVGVSASDCECITAGLSTDQKADIKKSTSGLYMDDLPGGIHLKSLDYIEACNDLAIMALRERDNAIRTLEDGLIIALNSEYKKTPNFFGQIGEMSITETLNTSGRYQGVRYRPVEYGDGLLTINRITLIVDTSATFKVYVYQGYAGGQIAEKIKEYSITTTANQYSTIIVEENADPKLAGLKLPLSRDSQSLEYFILFDRNEAGGALPKNNGFGCSTCGPVEKRASHYLESRGVEFNDLSSFTNTNADYYAHGFILDASIKCDNERLFCREYREQDAIAVAMAYAVWYKAGELLIEAVLKSPEVNRYTTMAREYLWGKRNHFRAEYDGRVVFLVNIIDVTASNCYVCKEETNQPFMAGIFS